LRRSGERGHGFLLPARGDGRKTKAQMTVFTALLGGALIGASASAMLLLLGRIAGVSGILASALRPNAGEDGRWRLLFLLGLVLGGLVAATLAPHTIGAPVAASVGSALFAGALVGAGVEIAGGCTSGHGVCGISRLAPRSIVATLTFMLTAGITVFVVRHVLGGAS
jgi:uncharacterized protein